MSEADDPPDTWLQYLPDLHRHLADPSLSNGLPKSFVGLNFEQTCAWWETLRYLFRALLGWRCVPAGLAWWYEIGRPVLGDPRLAWCLSVGTRAANWTSSRPGNGSLRGRPGVVWTNECGKLMAMSLRPAGGANSALVTSSRNTVHGEEEETRCTLGTAITWSATRQPGRRTGLLMPSRFRLS